MNAVNELGHIDWVQSVFEGTVARDVRGRSRPTQRYAALTADKQLVNFEGGCASIAKSVFETCKQAGIVSRFKPEPFMLKKSKYGFDAIPDFLCEIYDRQCYVVECKSTRYLTEERLEKCMRVQEVVNNAGMVYALWTDAWPLPPNIWQMYRTMRRCGNSAVSVPDLIRLQHAVERRSMTVAELRELGIYYQHILSSCWHGRTHFPIFNPLSDETEVSVDSSVRGLELTLNAPVEAHRFWRSL